MAAQNIALTLYVVTHNPRDYPAKFVVRERHVTRDGQIVTATAPSAVAETIEEARAAIPGDRVKLRPMPGDDPVIVEVWL